MNENRLGSGSRNSGNQIQAPGIIAKTFAFVATVALIGLAFMFSIVVFAIALVVGLVGWAWLWWKMRGLRQRMQEQAQYSESRYRGTRTEADVIEGEVIREVRESDESTQRRD